MTLTGPSYDSSLIGEAPGGAPLAPQFPTQPLVLAMVMAMLILLQTAVPAVGQLRIVTSPARPDQVAAEQTHVMIKATPLDSTTNNGKSIYAGVFVPGEVELPATSGGWTIELRREKRRDFSYWTPPKVLADVALTRSVDMEIWPTGSFSTQLLAESDGGGVLELPSDVGPLKARFSRAQARRSCCAKVDLEPTGEVECSRETEGETAFRCALPAAALDVRLRLEGYSAHYLWGHQVEEGKNSRLGPVKLEKGASLVGWVVTSDNGPLDRNIRATAMPGNMFDFDDRRGVDQITLEAVADDHGFFQFDGLKQGTYALEVEKPGYATTRVNGIEIFDDLEASLIHPVELRRPAVVTLVVDPPRDPSDRAWRGFLINRVRDAEISPVFQFDDGGTYQSQGLQPGNYILHVRSASGSTYYSGYADIDGETFLPVSIPLIPVRGLVKLGKEPVEADLVFGPPEEIKMRSGEDGQFEGYLPRDGAWEVEIFSKKQNVHRRLRKVKVEERNGTARLRFDLEDTLIEGIVVDPRGDPIDRALVVIRPEGSTESNFNVDIHQEDAGHFEVRGLPEGDLILSAHNDTAASPEFSVRLTEGMTPPPMRLVLEERRTVTGRLVGPYGVVPGATVAAAPTGLAMPYAWFLQDHSDARGQFFIRAPPETSELLLWVYAPGYSLRALRVSATSEDLGEIHLDRNGGTLSLRFPPERANDILLFNSGGPLSIHNLRHWIRTNPSLNTFSGPGTLIVPQVAPDLYIGCLLEDGTAEYYTAIRAGGRVPLGDCVQPQQLDPGSEVSINLSE